MRDWHVVVQEMMELKGIVAGRKVVYKVVNIVS
jgi:hypothetical protein